MPNRPLRVAHGIVTAGDRLTDLPARLAATSWDMVELDVMTHEGRLVVAHDPGELDRAGADQLDFSTALAELRRAVGSQVRFDVDIKATGYEQEVAAAIADAGLTERTLVSTMELSSLRRLREIAPSLRRGLSVPLARRNYLGNPLTRPAAFAMLAYLRRTLPARVAAHLQDGVADAIMAHYGVVTPALVAATGAAELYAWTVDDPARLPRLAALGVTGVITNEPEVFAAVAG